MSTAPVVLVLGAGGQLGRALARARPPAGLRLVGAPRGLADVRDAGALDRLLSATRAGVIVNAAAFTAVDRAEAEPQAAFAVNEAGAGNVAEAAARAGAALIHLSSDYVFDGAKGAPYAEGDPVAPLSVYGRSKAAGEALVRQGLARHVILRTAWLFGPDPGNFLTAMLGLCGPGGAPEVRVVADQRGSPTPVDDLAAMVLTIAARILAGRGRFGTLHAAGRPAATWLELAGAIFAAAARPGAPQPRLLPTTAAAWGAPALRPGACVLDCRRIADWYGLQAPDWRRGVDRAVAGATRAGVYLISEYSRPLAEM